MPPPGTNSRCSISTGLWDDSVLIVCILVPGRAKGPEDYWCQVMARPGTNAISIGTKLCHDPIIPIAISRHPVVVAGTDARMSTIATTAGNFCLDL